MTAELAAEPHQGSRPRDGAATDDLSRRRRVLARRSAGGPAVVGSPSAITTGPAPAGSEAARVALSALTTRLAQAGQAIGFPAAADVNWSPLAGVFTAGLINNLGTPYIDGRYPRHAKDLERQAIDLLADLLRAPADDRWGYIGSGDSEGLLWALRLGRRMLPGAVVYFSAAAHPAVAEAVDTLAMRSVVVGVDEGDEIDYRDLSTQIAARRDRPVVVVANAGTTWTEAVDDVRRIHAELDRLAVPSGRRFVLVDAALSGLPLATQPPGQRPGFDFADGADAIVVSGHKFLATPMPCAAVLTRAQYLPAGPAVAYTDSPHTTLSFSRNGHAAVAIWYVLTVLGRDGLAARAQQSRLLAEQVHARLAPLGWQPRRHPHAMTVTLTAPPDALRDRYGLTDVGGRSHLVCAPGITAAYVDELVTALATCLVARGPARDVDDLVSVGGPRDGKSPTTVLSFPRALGAGAAPSAG